MISQSLFETLGMCAAIVRPTNPRIEGELHSYIRPYVLVIHRPSGRGFYLNREYRHIISVECCKEPESPVETKRHHLCASTNLPAWVKSDFPGRTLEFDSFWLY